jgi:hypothetical protein
VLAAAQDEVELDGHRLLTAPARQLGSGSTGSDSGRMVENSL